jgi:hypothetical protein
LKLRILATLPLILLAFFALIPLTAVSASSVSQAGASYPAILDNGPNTNSTSGGHHIKPPSVTYGINTTESSTADTYSRIWSILTADPSSYAGSGVWDCGGGSTACTVYSNCTGTFSSGNTMNCTDPNYGNGLEYWLCISVPSSVGYYDGRVTVYNHGGGSLYYDNSLVTETSCAHFNNQG